MITGRVTPDREAVIGIEVAGPSDRSHRIEAVIDTGYNGHLTLPSQLIGTLHLAFAGHRRGMLADGSDLLLDVYLATVIWHGKPREVLVSQAEGAALVGMSLLRGSRLKMDVVDGGHVAIEELP